MSLIPETPPHPPPEQVEAVGAWGGPTFTYRGATIRCMKGGHVCGLHMPGHPLDGISRGVPGTLTPLIDLWLDEQRLPSYMKVVPKAR